MENKNILHNIIRSTPYGSVAIIWTKLNENPKIIRILISNPEIRAEDQIPIIYPNSQKSSTEGIDKLMATIKAFLEGDDVVFSLDRVDLEICSPFQKAVLLAEYRIPRGSISTYQLIARHLGKKMGARAVGNALAKNPFPIIIPCHRAIRSDGTIGGFQGGLEMKKDLLEAEGISFDKNERVISQRFYYKNNGE